MTLRLNLSRSYRRWSGTQCRHVACQFGTRLFLDLVEVVVYLARPLISIDDMHIDFVNSFLEGKKHRIGHAVALLIV